MVGRGSFLSRGKETLAKMAAEMSKTPANLNGPRNSSRNFVFSTVSAEQKEKMATASAKPLVSFVVGKCVKCVEMIFVSFSKLALLMSSAFLFYCR